MTNHKALIQEIKDLREIRLNTDKLTDDFKNTLELALGDWKNGLADESIEAEDSTYQFQYSIENGFEHLFNNTLFVELAKACTEAGLHSKIEQVMDENYTVLVTVEL